jgi:hypothetical protein
MFLALVLAAATSPYCFDPSTLSATQAGGNEFFYHWFAPAVRANRELCTGEYREADRDFESASSQTLREDPDAYRRYVLEAVTAALLASDDATAYKKIADLLQFKNAQYGWQPQREDRLLFAKHYGDAIAALAADDSKRPRKPDAQAAYKPPTTAPDFVLAVRAGDYDKAAKLLAGANDELDRLMLGDIDMMRGDWSDAYANWTAAVVSWPMGAEMEWHTTDRWNNTPLYMMWYYRTHMPGRLAEPTARRGSGRAAA